MSLFHNITLCFGWLLNWLFCGEEPRNASFTSPQDAGSPEHMIYCSHALSTGIWYDKVAALIMPSRCSSTTVHSLNPDDRSCLSPDLSQSLLLLEADLLPQSHDLESLEVGESPSLCALVPALGEWCFCPLLLDFLCLPLCGQWTVSDGAGNLLHDNRRESDVGELCGVTWDGEGGIFGRTINENLDIQ